VKIVSFSGIDGAGKSTQICALEDWLRSTGLTTKTLTFWDDIVVAARFRESVSHLAFKGDKGIGSPEKPLERRDKNVTSLPVVAARFFLYLADAINLSRKVSEVRKSSFDVVIFDRYIYDELANLPQNRRLVRAFIWLALKLVPKPDVAYFIDADPEAARARKPEYLTLAQFSGDITVIEPTGIDAAKVRVREAFLRARDSEESLRPELCDETAK
jgi:thymidylate kinase